MARVARRRVPAGIICRVDPLGAADLLLGRALERALAAHHRHRLRRLGRLDALEPPDDGSPWCREAPPPRDGCSIDVLIDGAEVLPAIAEAIRGARRSVRDRGLALGAALRARARRAADRAARAAGRGGRARRRRARAALGRRAVPRCSRPRARTSAPTRASWRAAPACASRSTTHERPAALPPREARRRRRRGRVRRRRRPHRPRRRPLGHARSIPPAGGSAGTTPARGCAARSSPTSPSTSTCAGPRSPASELPAVPVPAPAGDTTVQLLRTVPEHIYDRHARRRVRHPRGLHARAARRARARLPRVAVLLAAGDRATLLCEQAARAAQRPLPRRRAAALQGEQRRGGHARDARPSRRRRRRPRALPGRDDRRDDRLDGRPALRPRQDRHRRRPLADDRLGQPQRPLVLQRHRGQRPGLRPGARARDAAAAVERAPRACRRTRSPGTRRTSSIGSGSRSRGASASAARAGSGASTASASSRPSSRKLERLLGPMDAIVVDG